MNTIELQSLVYPVFKLPDKPNVEEGVIYYYSEIEKEDIVYSRLLIIDDTNIDEDTLSARRLKLLSDRVPLYRLRNAIFFLGDLIKLAKPSTHFIDSSGRLFNYKKTTNANLKFYKITKLLPISTGGAIIEVAGLPNRFKVLKTPTTDVVCAGILHIGMTTIMYGLYDYVPENTRRMI